MRKIQVAIPGFEEIRGPLEAGKIKKMDYFLELPEGNPAPKTLILACVIQFGFLIFKIT